MTKILLKIIAFLPLPLIHGLGIFIGGISYLTDRKFARRIRNNLHKSKLASKTRSHAKLVRLSTKEIGKGMLETFAIWVKSERSVLKWVKRCEGWHYVEEALLQKKGIIFMTPHLGCYEITARYYASKHPMTILYTPARKSWLGDIMESGRQRSKTTLAPANLSGVRALLKTLRKGNAVGILPDQVPDLGDGTWATYFGEPAYSMTLVSKLVETTGATVLLAYGERLPWGRGFVIHIEPLTTETTPQDINNAIEHLVRKKPEQYLWSYRRFKHPQLAREKRVKINAEN
ncbi:MAG: lysophospholipid acyltransferase family protein [Methylotenera sp.]|nr:lysophospholipid acyltransferase family protein [Methylotenera sp.]